MGESDLNAVNIREIIFRFKDRFLEMQGFPIVILGLFLCPILAGILGSLLPAFGYLPGVGEEAITLHIWSEFWQYPSVLKSICLSLYVGVIATLLAFMVTNIFCAFFYNKSFFIWIRRGVGPLLSVPHAALAMGMLLLLAPSGWIFRLTSPWLTGETRPLDWAIFPDSYGIGLIFAIMIKEIPFLLLMTLSATNEISIDRYLKLVETFNYGSLKSWVKIILPQIYNRLRLPLMAVLVFSVSVVDMALVLVPSSSPNLGMLILRWYQDAELDAQFLAAMGAVMQTVVVLVAVGIWLGFEGLARWYLRWILDSSDRYFISKMFETIMAYVTKVIAISVVGIGALSVLILLIWSFVGRWKFADALPQKWSMRYWDRHINDLSGAFMDSTLIAFLTTSIALFLVIGCLEGQQKLTKSHGDRMLKLLYLPLLIPQVAFLFGVQLLVVWLRLDGLYVTVVWGHLLFVLPYVYLSLLGPYQAFDTRYIHTARMLGRSEFTILFKVKLAMLLRPILIAFAVGFAVSVTLYLPTLFLGAGRIETLTTEALALSSGGDRRVIGIYAFVQTLLPFIVFLIATVTPLLVYRNKLGMRGGR